MSIQLCQQYLRGADGLVKVVKFKCNGCSGNTEFVWLEDYSTAHGFRVYQCLRCCAVGTKNLAEATDNQEPVKRCDQYGHWMFVDEPCHTCELIATKL